MVGIVWPIDLFNDSEGGFPGWSTEFEPVYRQEYSRQANGATIGKDFGTLLWKGSWQTKRLKPNALDYWRARLESLQGLQGTFYAWPSSRLYPSAHANGTGLPGSPTLGSIDGTRELITLSGASGLTLNIGDMISIGAWLHRVQQGSTNGGQFAVTPYIAPDVTTGTAVRVNNPRCVMRLVPGSVVSSADIYGGWGVLTFQGVQAI